MNFKGYKDSEVIEIYSSAIEEMINRKIIRTKNMTGELGERLTVDYFNANAKLPNLTLCEIGQDYYDAVDDNNNKYSIKTVTTKATGTFHAMESENREYFDYLIVCKLNEKTFKMEHLYIFSWREFLQVRKWHTTMNAWYVRLSQEAIETSSVVL